MSSLSSIVLPAVPEPGASVPDLSAWTDTLPVFAAMAACAQDERWHREGAVLPHTQLVCQELVSDPDWQVLSVPEREELWWAALLHDCAKPQRTRFEDGRLRSPGHARAGAILARELLWRAGVEPAARERVCGLVRWHMTPYHFLERPQPPRLAAECSLSAHAERLVLLVGADARGREAEDTAELAEQVELFAAFCEELGCLHAPYPFASDHARVEFFRHPGRDLSYGAYDDSRCELTIMVGLPGAGKDRWCAQHADGRAVISLDSLRVELGVRRGDDRAGGRMLQVARERLRVELRAGRSCIWNATNLSRTVRAPLLALAADYRARVRIVCVECPPVRLAAQNRERAGALPESAIERLLARWEAPTLADCHELEVVDSLAS